MLGRDSDGKFIISVSQRIYLTVGTGPANTEAGEGIEIVLREDRAGISILTFSLNY